MNDSSVQLTIICLTLIVLACIGGMVYNQSTFGTLSTLAGTRHRCHCGNPCSHSPKPESTLMKVFLTLLAFTLMTSLAAAASVPDGTYYTIELPCKCGGISVYMPDSCPVFFSGNVP